MLLALLVCQLTADLPGRFPWANAADLPLTLLVGIVGERLHCAPLETAYTCPQVALRYGQHLRTWVRSSGSRHSRPGLRRHSPTLLLA